MSIESFQRPVEFVRRWWANVRRSTPSPRKQLGVSPCLLWLAVAVSGCTAAPHIRLFESSSDSPRTAKVSGSWGAVRNESYRIPGGETCLEWLGKLGIQHRTLPEMRGMETPVEVTGPVGGVRYLVHGSPQVTADCRLILALDWIGPHLRQFGVTEVRHSGAYVYRTKRSGGLSLHARGLALDVHEFVVERDRFEVESEYRRGLGEACSLEHPPLNQIVCRLRSLRLFQELITPDHNADHHDHIHLAISPLTPV